MTSTGIRRVAAALGFAGVALGAFGAHALKDRLAQGGWTHTWETAVLYHLLHAVLIVAISRPWPLFRGPIFCFLGGVLVFSGSLYCLCLSGIKILGAITPVGGVLFLVGWAWMGCVVWRDSGPSEPESRGK